MPIPASAIAPPLPPIKLLRAQLVSVSRPFHPAQIPGCQLWLPADRIQGLSDGDPVTTWNDHSGKGRNATQATAARKPTYKVGILNGKPVVRFDGVDDRMTLAAFQTFPNKRGTIFVVATLGTVVGDRALLGADYVGVNIGWEYAHSAGALDIFWFDDVASQELEDIDPTGTSISEVVRTSDTSLTFLRNGAQKNTITITNNQPDSVVLTVGGSNDAGDFWNSDIAEIIIYEGEKSPSDRHTIRKYLARKYLLSVS